MKPAIGLPFPDGWFCVATSTDVPPGAVKPVTFMGEERVLFRTESGALSLMDAYCPHLGAHMGHGGTVRGETLRCPFHGFCFDRSGACVETAYGTKPPARARVRSWPVREKHGLVLAWYHHDGREPDWEIPDLDVTGWSKLLLQRWSLRGHPQETSENSVDIGHFGVVHGYDRVETVVPAKADGPLLTTRYRFHRFIGKGALGFTATVDIDIRVHGLGYSLVEMALPMFGVRSRQLVLPVPTTQDHIDLRIAMMTEDVGRSEQIRGWLPDGLPTGLLTRLVAEGIFAAYRNDVGQDFDIWKNKRYLSPPVLAAGDGPIMLYRRWASQFYPVVTDRAEGAARAEGAPKRALPVLSDAEA